MFDLRLPLSDQVSARFVVSGLQEVCATCFVSAGLLDKRFAERVMAVDQKVVAAMKSFKDFDCGDLGEFTRNSSIAAATCQYQIPDAVKIHVRQMQLQDMWQEIIMDGVAGTPEALQDARACA